MTNLPRPHSQSIQWSAPAAAAVLAAMKAIATLNGARPLDSISRDMLTAAKTWVFPAEMEIDDLALLSPADLAEQVHDQRQRQQALQFLILMPYLDTQVDDAEVELVNAYATELDLTPTTLKSLQLVRDRKFKQLLMAYTGRSLAALLPGRGLWQKLKVTVQALRQYVGDAQVAREYQALGELPVGTLGRGLFEYYRDRNFPLPGEKKSLSELLVSHDLVHLLSGIDTDMEGEITVGGFEAGMSRSEFGFELLLEVILDFHMGVEFSNMGLFPAARHHLNPTALLQAYARGQQMQFDLLDPNWDFKAVFDQPISMLRQRYEIPEFAPALMMAAP